MGSHNVQNINELALYAHTYTISLKLCVCVCVRRQKHTQVFIYGGT